MEELERIENNFKYHQPLQGQAIRYEQIRAEGKRLAKLIYGFCPKSRVKSLALTKIEEAVMWANAAIARNEKETEVFNTWRC